MDTGDLIAGRFMLLSRVGVGGMGTVFEAEDRLEGGQVALKVLHETVEQAERLRFLRECSVLASLQEPGIVGYVDQGTSERGEPFLAMEWVEGPSLRARLRHSVLTLQESLELVRRLAVAVGALHSRGMVHRDLKPGNVMLAGDDPTKPMLLDLGIVRPAEGGFTIAGSIMGTPGYMAPEQARGEPDIDARADVFALGTLLYKCASGRSPFGVGEPMATLLRTLVDEPVPLSELQPEVPASVQEVVTCMLAKNRQDRPKDGHEVARLLAEISLEPEVEEAPRSERYGLTDMERRVTCLVVGRCGDPELDEEATKLDAPSSLPDLQPVLAPMQARYDVLADGTLVVSFGDTSGSASDLATRGARCALALRHSYPDMRLVVVTGSAIATGHTLVGSTIDRAAGMLVGKAPPTLGIAIDPSTASLVESRFEVETTAAGALLLAERESEGLRTLLGKPAELVGRQSELLIVRAWIDESITEPRARAVLVTAPAGLGKSRLRHELLSRLQEDRPDVVVWTMHGDPLSAASPFGLVGPLLRRLAGIGEIQPEQERRERLRDWAAQRIPPDHVERVADFLGELAALPSPDGGSVELQAARRDHALMGDQLRRAFTDLVVAECSRACLVLVVEDLQWGDLPSVKLLDAALCGAQERPLFVMALGRPEVHDVFPRLWQEHGLQQLRLEPLSRSTAAQLVRQALGSGISKEIVDRVVERGEGNAFFLEELIRAVAAGQLDALPETVLATVQARLDALPSEARQVLRAASVFGQRSTSAGVKAVLGDTSFDSEGCLVELVREEILTPSGNAGYAFRQALMQEAAYAMLTDEDRELGHRLAAKWLEQAGGGDPVGLAEHFERGQRAPRAVPWWTMAAQHALGGNDLDQVIDCVDRAVACGAVDEALGQLEMLAAEAHLWRGEHDVAEHLAREALARVLLGSPSYCKAASVGATAAGRCGHHDARSEIAGKILALDPSSDSEPDRVIALAQCSIQESLAGDLASADELLARLERADEAALRDDAAAAYFWRASAWRAIVAGDPGTYGALMRLSAERFERIGDIRNACMQQVNVAYAAASVGEYETAIQGYREVIGTSSRLGLANTTAVARHNLGLALAMLGQHEQAAREETLALEAFEVQVDQRLQGMCHGYLAIIACQQGDLVKAEQAARKCLDILQAATPPRAASLGLLARVLHAAGTVEEALLRARQAQELLDRLGGVDEGEGTIRLAYAEALAAAGHEAEAHRAIAIARDRLVERAATITPPSWRQSFLERVPEHAHTLALAAEWLGRDDPEA